MKTILNEDYKNKSWTNSGAYIVWERNDNSFMNWTNGDKWDPLHTEINANIKNNKINVEFYDSYFTCYTEKNRVSDIFDGNNIFPIITQEHRSNMKILYSDDDKLYLLYGETWKPARIKKYEISYPNNFRLENFFIFSIDCCSRNYKNFVVQYNNYSKEWELRLFNYENVKIEEEIIDKTKTNFDFKKYCSFKSGHEGLLLFDYKDFIGFGYDNDQVMANDLNDFGELF